jgi:hypothetical protein
MKKLLVKLSLLLTITLMSACFQEDPLTEKPDSPDASSLNTASTTNGRIANATLSSFPVMKWWSYFPRLTNGDRYMYNSSIDGVSWNAANTSGSAFLPAPTYLHGVYHNDAIYVIELVNNAFRLKYSPDGLNWTTPQLVNINYQKRPRLASINGELYAYYIDSSTTGGSLNYNINVLRYSESVHDFLLLQYRSISTYFLNSDTATFTPPCYAFYDNKHFLFYFKNPSNSAEGEAYFIRSDDGLNWNNPVPIASGSMYNISNLDVAVFKEAVYLSFKRYDTGQVAYIKFKARLDGSGTYENIVYPTINGGYKTRGLNAPIAADGNKMVISFRDGSNDYNRFVYSTDGLFWSLVTTAPGTSNGNLRLLIKTP